MGTYDHINLTPTKAMANAANIGLKMIKSGKGKKNIEASALARARKIAGQNQLTPAEVKALNVYFANTKPEGEGFERGSEGFPSPLRVDWQLRGSYNGQKWAAARVQQMELADKKKKKAYQNNVSLNVTINIID